MKENLFSTPEPEELVTIAKDVDADDPEASDLLDVIGRETSEEEQPEEPTKAVTRTARERRPIHVGVTLLSLLRRTRPVDQRRRSRAGEEDR